MVAARLRERGQRAHPQHVPRSAQPSEMSTQALAHPEAAIAERVRQAFPQQSAMPARDRR